jgi:hypothetical protein
MSEPIDDYGPAWPRKATDPIVEAVREKLWLRSVIGQRKYGCSMMRDDLDTRAWLRHAQNEALDFAVYLERLLLEFGREVDDGR